MICKEVRTFDVIKGFVAQLAEQLTLNQWAEGSIPSGVTLKSSTCIIAGVFLYLRLPLINTKILG